MNFEFVFDKLNNYKANLSKEWLLTNGLGGYAGSSIIGAHLRTHQGYLIASIKPPMDRFLAFSKTNERIVCGSRIYDLTTAQHKGPYTSEINQGNMHLKQFKYDGSVTYVYQAGGMCLTKTIALVYGKNQCVISYTLENNGPAAGVVITPLMNFRRHGDHMTVDDLRWTLPEEVFEEIRDEKSKNAGFFYKPVGYSNVRVSLISAGCEMVKRNNIYDENMELQYEIDNGAEGLDCHLKPYDFVIEVEEGGVSKASFVCTVDVKGTGKNGGFAPLPTVDVNTAELEAEKARKRVNDLIEESKFTDEEEVAQILTVAARQFIVDRGSNGEKALIAGYPWLTETGRDTMIALSGVCLETGRFEDAKSILRSYSKLIKNGLLPESFTEEGGEPVYNSVDTALWYFYAVRNYLKYADSDDAWKFVEDEIFPGLQEIMGACRKGTLNSIGMGDDALLHAGDDKPVDINALWYNALKTMEEISRGIAKRTHNKPENYLAYAGGCSELAKWVKEAFTEEFWDDGGIPVSLPFTMVPPPKEKSEEEIKAYFEIIEQHLLRNCIGSLSENIDEKYEGSGCYASALAVGEALCIGF